MLFSYRVRRRSAQLLLRPAAIHYHRNCGLFLGDFSGGRDVAEFYFIFNFFILQRP